MQGTQLCSPVNQITFLYRIGHLVAMDAYILLNISMILHKQTTCEKSFNIRLHHCRSCFATLWQLVKDNRFKNASFSWEER